MGTKQAGFSGLLLLLVAASIAALSLVAIPEYQVPSEAGKAMVEKVKVAEALNFVGESKRKIADSFTATRSLPRTADETRDMWPSMAQKPKFVRKVKFQHDYAGETVMIMVYLKDGVVENILGGEQYIYVAGIKSREANDTLEWQCGARNVDLNLLPEECRS